MTLKTLKGKWGKWDKEGEAANRGELSSQSHLGVWDGFLWENSVKENFLTREVKELKNPPTNSRQRLVRAAPRECQSPGLSICLVPRQSSQHPWLWKKNQAKRSRSGQSHWRGAACLRNKSRTPIVTYIWGMDTTLETLVQPHQQQVPKRNPLSEWQTWMKFK